MGTKRSYFENKRNEKALKTVQELEQAGGAPVSQSVVTGRQQFAWSDLTTWLTCGFVVLFVAVLIGGGVAFSGGILIFLWYQSVKPVRFLSIANDRVTLWKTSIFTGKATEPLAAAFFADVRPQEGWVTVGDNPPIKLSDKELAHLNAAVSWLGVPAVPTQPPVGAYAAPTQLPATRTPVLCLLRLGCQPELTPVPRRRVGPCQTSTSTRPTTCF